ncbi:MAG: DUF5606 domain-containing protein [Flavobacteriales bacterium]|nr:DUF5606 domain-containing protein [Flavobacteriales bacterium]
MDLSKIISVAGKSGLFRVVAQARQAVIAESLEDGKRVPIPSSVRVNSLEEISIFTTGDDVPLKGVLEKLHSSSKGTSVGDPKGDEEALWKKLGEVLPEHDRGRIYPSDLRKLFSWYDLLLKAGVFDQKEEAKDKSEEDGKAAKTAGKKGSKATKAAAAVKKANAPKPGAGSKAKSAGTTLRKSSQRGS